MIQLHRLEGFYRVAIAGGYARAARNFPYPITQPAVHQQVRKLEQDLGAKLFERASKDQMRLTAAGRMLHEFCAPFFEQLPGVVRAIEVASFGGELRIDASGLALHQMMPAWIKRLRRSRPDIQVDLTEIETPDPERLRRGDADLLVDWLPQVPKGLSLTRVGQAHIFLVLPSDHPLAKRKRLALSDLHEEPFVSYTLSLPHGQMQLRELERAGNVPARMLSAGSVASILGFVGAGLGYSLVPWLDAKGPKARGVVTHRMTSDDTALPIVAAWWQGSAPNPLVQSAIEVAPTT
jgi:DNA-binding transcriptional LysR family regulator